ncbi:MAG: dihydroorotase [Proteobacteria bacterium]|nr:dihydroorotase [Pseudomonadota bacterium]
MTFKVGQQASRQVDLILRGGIVALPDGIAARDIAVSAGRIVAIGDLAGFSAAEVLDCRNLHVLPGVIDSQVHFREPGAEHKEDLETGSRAAVMGGVTVVFEMPNTKPLTTSAAALADKVGRARNRMFCDFAFYVGGTRDNVEGIPDFERLEGSAGMKVFIGSSTGDLLVDDDAGLDRIISRLSRRAAFHSEDEFRLKARTSFQVPGDAASHPVWRDAEAARLCTERLLRIARRHGKRVHVLHVSTQDELPLLAAHRDCATVEVTPHHLTLSADDYARLGTKLQMNPPVRSAEHREALWQAISSGLVDVLGSDHAPHTLEEKAKPYPASPSGMPGVQTLVPMMLDHVNKGRLTLERFVDLTAHGPQRIFGLANKGRIAEGYDADFTLVDLKRREVIRNDWIESRCGWTPYDGVAVTGWPVGTMIRGRTVMWQGEIPGPAQGAPARFVEALQPERM